MRVKQVLREKDDLNAAFAEMSVEKGKSSRRCCGLSPFSARSGVSLALRATRSTVPRLLGINKSLHPAARTARRWRQFHLRGANHHPYFSRPLRTRAESGNGQRSGSLTAAQDLSGYGRVSVVRVFGTASWFI